MYVYVFGNKLNDLYSYQTAKLCHERFAIKSNDAEVTNEWNFYEIGVIRVVNRWKCSNSCTDRN